MHDFASEILASFDVQNFSHSTEAKVVAISTKNSISFLLQMNLPFPSSSPNSYFSSITRRSSILWCGTCLPNAAGPLDVESLLAIDLYPPALMILLRLSPSESMDVVPYFICGIRI